jgi:hypothetical protein
MRLLAATLLLALATSATAAPKKLGSCEQDMGCSFAPVPSDLIKISASSTLADKRNRYAVTSLLDESEATAWCEGKKDDGVGETITVEFEKPVEVELILVTPFYAKSFATAEKNNRVKRMTLTLDGDELEIEAGAHLYNMCTGKADPKDPCTEMNAPQNFALDKVRTLRKVTLTIDAVDRGSNYRDTCLSTLRFLQPVPA